jgi:5,10-methylene-tetrahydrofolate dehydrogenase/methenyl tetrahydrofolate cyclohydrolase
VLAFLRRCASASVTHKVKHRSNCLQPCAIMTQAVPCDSWRTVPTLWHWHADTSTCNPLVLAAISKQMNELLECDGAHAVASALPFPVQEVYGMKVGIIGTRNIGGIIARKLKAAGHDVRVANSRGIEGVRAFANEIAASAVGQHAQRKWHRLSPIAANQRFVIDRPIESITVQLPSKTSRFLVEFR